MTQDQINELESLKLDFGLSGAQTAALDQAIAQVSAEGRQTGSDDSLLHPAQQVYFRAGLLACREYMARFVEAESPSIANSIRANWWPSLGQDFGPPRQLDFAEVTSGEFGTPDFRVKTADEVSPTQEALPIALGFLQIGSVSAESAERAESAGMSAAPASSPSAGRLPTTPFCKYRGKGDPPQECDYPNCGCEFDSPSGIERKIPASASTGPTTPEPDDDAMLRALELLIEDGRKLRDTKVVVPSVAYSRGSDIDIVCGYWLMRLRTLLKSEAPASPSSPLVDYQFIVMGQPVIVTAAVDEIVALTARRALEQGGFSHFIQGQRPRAYEIRDRDGRPLSGLERLGDLIERGTMRVFVNWTAGIAASSPSVEQE